MFNPSTQHAFKEVELSFEAVIWALNESPVGSPASKIVLVCLANDASADGSCARVDVEKLAWQSSMSVDEVRTVLGELVESGVLIHTGGNSCDINTATSITVLADYNKFERSIGSQPEGERKVNNPPKNGPESEQKVNFWKTLGERGCEKSEVAGSSFNAARESDPPWAKESSNAQNGPTKEKTKKKRESQQSLIADTGAAKLNKKGIETCSPHQEIVLDICDHLATRIEGYRGKKPKISKRWEDDVDKLLRLGCPDWANPEPIPPEKIHRMIDFIFDHCERSKSGFAWADQIRSGHGLRDHWDQLRVWANGVLAAKKQREQDSSEVVNGWMNRSTGSPDG